MVIDLSVLGRIAEAAFLVVLGIFINRWFERRPRLVAYYGHVGAFQLQPSGGFSGGPVHTHSVVIQNTGKVAAHNVRLPHNFPLAPPLNFSIEPPTAFTPTKLHGGGEEITFPVLAPGQQVTVSYLYFPPLLFHQINRQISSDEGMARQLNVLPTLQQPRWRLAIFQFLMFIGVVTLVYLVVELALWIKAQGFL